jgi:hypothetical protein
MGFWLSEEVEGVSDERPEDVEAPGVDEGGFQVGVDEEGFQAGVDEEGSQAGVDDEGFQAGVDEEGSQAGVDDEGSQAGIEEISKGLDIGFIPPDVPDTTWRDSKPTKPLPESFLRGRGRKSSLLGR